MKIIKQLNKLNQTKQYLDSNYNTLIQPDNSYISDSKILLQNKFVEYTSIQGWRSTNEDEFLCVSNGNDILLAVFDGHGGDWVSNYCSQFYANILFETEEYKKQNYIEAFQEANRIMDFRLFEETAETMYKYAKSEITQTLFKYRQDLAKFNNVSFHHSDKCGCTCCAVLITPTKIICSNIGDSKAIIIHNDYSYNVLNREHKLSLKSEFDRVSKSKHGVINERVGGVLNLTRCFGDFEFKDVINGEFEDNAIISEPEISFTERSLNNDWIIIGCDGLWDCFNEDDVSKFMLNTYNLFRNSKSQINKIIEMNVKKINKHRNLVLTNSMRISANLARNCISDENSEGDFGI